MLRSTISFCLRVRSERRALSSTWTATESWASATSWYSQSCLVRKVVDPVVFQFDTPPGSTQQMVLVPAGPFLMGADDRLSNQAPQRTVTLDSFYVDVFEVTNRQYLAFLNDTEPTDSVGATYVDLGDMELRITQAAQGYTVPDTTFIDHPVVLATWPGADAFFHG